MNIICVKWGDLYSSYDVNILDYMLSKNVSSKYKLYCLTDNNIDINDDINIINLPHNNDFETYWNKLYLFNKEIIPVNEFTYFDLDVVIQNNIDDLLSYSSDNITLINATWKEPEVFKNKFNSSVMNIDLNRDGYIWDEFNKDPDLYMCKYFGDDDFITKKFKFNTYPDDWFYSTKYGNHPVPMVYLKDPMVCLLNGVKRWHPKIYYDKFKYLYPEYQYHLS